MTVSYSKGYL